MIKIINEPTAAALAYGIGEKSDLKKSEEDDDFFLLKDPNPKDDNFPEKTILTILVFDLGGGTLDATCLKLIKDEDGKEFKILGHSGNTLLDGDDFDNILVNHCIEKNLKKNLW